MWLLLLSTPSSASYLGTFSPLEKAHLSVTFDSVGEVYALSASSSASYLGTYDSCYTFRNYKKDVVALACISSTYQIIDLESHRSPPWRRLIRKTVENGNFDAKLLTFYPKFTTFFNTRDVKVLFFLFWLILTQFAHNDQTFKWGKKILDFLRFYRLFLSFSQFHTLYYYNY